MPKAAHNTSIFKEIHALQHQKYRLRSLVARLCLRSLEVQTTIEVYHVGDCDAVLRHDKCDVKGGLDGRLVPARERATRIGGLKPDKRVTVATCITQLCR